MDIKKLDQYTTAMFKEMQEARDAAIGVGAYAEPRTIAGSRGRIIVSSIC